MGKEPISENKQPAQLNLADVSGSFKEAARMLKETAMLMALKHLLNAPKDKERADKEAWLKRIGNVITWMENYSETEQPASIQQPSNKGF